MRLFFILITVFLFSPLLNANRSAAIGIQQRTDIPESKRISYQTLNSKEIGNDIARKAAKIGFGKTTDIKTRKGGSLGVALSALYAMVKANLRDADFALDLLLDGVIFDDDITVDVDPVIVSYDKNCKAPDCLNATVQVKITITFRVNTIGNGNALSQTVQYYYGQEIKVDQQTGEASAVGDPTRFKAAVISETRQSLNKKLDKKV